MCEHRTCMWSIIDRRYKKFSFYFQLKIWPDCFYSSRRNNCRHFFFYLFSYNREYQANEYSYSLFSFIVNTFIFLITLYIEEILSYVGEFKHLNSNLLKCRSNKKIFLIISVFCYWKNHTFFWLELSYARFLHSFHSDECACPVREKWGEDEFFFLS